MTRLFSILIFLTIIVLAFLSLKPNGEHSTANVTGLPWQIELLPEGRSKVMGVTLGQSTLHDAREHIGNDMQLAVIVASGEDKAGLEMFYSRYKAGVFSGKLVLAADIPPASLAEYMQRAIKTEYTGSGARKFILNAEDRQRALQAPVASMTFIPTVKIDESSVTKRFGDAAELIRGADQVTHLLYPDKGLDLMINEKGRGVFQYVAPRDFERLRQPLLEFQ